MTTLARMLTSPPSSFEVWHGWFVPPIVVPAIVIAIVAMRALYLYS